ncbi:MAG: hypothetical protein CMB16_00565 [Euryarchaeota archaeon]|jgi:hypothetical protein|nr:hypothetical protein [Euryarchaeota archaeon]MBA87745.1 hypothetical protein [Euryarchaeota archaeon]|tara:strand:+ start:2377 stop:3258 length:882 start_codon:yes stop_codon:yes gene_type:complete
MNEVAEAITPQESGQANDQGQETITPTQTQPTNDAGGYNWKNDIPEELKGTPSLDTIEDVPSLIKGYVHAQRMVGADKVALLGKHATDDEYNDFYKKIGRPDEPNQYQYEIDENATVPDETVTGMSNVFHKAGLTQRQANFLMNEFIESGMGSNPMLQPADEKQILANRQASMDALQKEWGNGYNDNLAIANSVMMEFGNIELREQTQSDGSKLGDNPDIIRLLANVGTFIRERVSEDKLAGTKMVGGMTVDEARGKLGELKRPDSPFWDAKHPEHKWYVEEAFRLQETVDGN